MQVWGLTQSCFGCFWLDRGFYSSQPRRNALLDHHSARGVGQFVLSVPQVGLNGVWMSRSKNRGPIPSHQGR